MGFVNAHFIAYTGDLGATPLQGAYALAPKQNRRPKASKFTPL